VRTIPRPPLSNRTAFIAWLRAESNRRHVDFQSLFPTNEPPEYHLHDGCRTVSGMETSRNIVKEQSKDKFPITVKKGMPRSRFTR